MNLRFLALIWFIQANTVYADFSRPAVSILYGDTIEVLHNHRAERIRLNGIDCPEKGQAFSHKAKQATSALVFDKEVTLHKIVIRTKGNSPVDKRFLASRAEMSYVSFLTGNYGKRVEI